MSNDLEIVKQKLKYRVMHYTQLKRKRYKNKEIDYRHGLTQIDTDVKDQQCHT